MSFSLCLSFSVTLPFKKNLKKLNLKRPVTLRYKYLNIERWTSTVGPLCARESAWTASVNHRWKILSKRLASVQNVCRLSLLLFPEQYNTTTFPQHLLGIRHYKPSRDDGKYRGGCGLALCQYHAIPQILVPMGDPGTSAYKYRQ